MLNSRNPTSKLARWALAIQEMNLTIKHRSGKKNTNADALSRNPVEVLAVSTECPCQTSLPPEIQQEVTRIVELQRSDQELTPMINYLEKGTLPEDMMHRPRS